MQSQEIQKAYLYVSMFVVLACGYKKF